MGPTPGIVCRRRRGGELLARRRRSQRVVLSSVAPHRKQDPRKLPCRSHAFKRSQDHRRYLDLERRFVAKAVRAGHVP